MPTVSAPASVADDARHDGSSLSLTLAITASVLSLAAVVVGFALVAVALVGASGVSLGWGAGLCVGGWALAAVARERTRGRAGTESSAPTE